MLRSVIACFAVILLLLTGCKNPEDEPVKEHKEKEIGDVQKEEVFSNFFPLTGLGTKEASRDRAVAVMINNHTAARPQSGLDKADVVYELLAEGSLTRFLAIFQSEKPDNIGPVRSARDYYIELAKGYNSFFVAHGYSPDAKKMLDNRYIDNINGIQYDGSLFKRSKNRKAPHNSYITYENILIGANKKKYDMNQVPEPLLFLSKDEQKQLGDPTVTKVTVSYISKPFAVTYEYDEEIEKYKRFSNGAQTVDYNTGNPVLLDNVFVVETKHEVVDSAGRRKIDLNSGGKAYLFQKGTLKAVEWKNVNNRILPVVNGVVIGFVPGKTWINIIPTNPGISKAVQTDIN